MTSRVLDPWPMGTGMQVVRALQKILGLEGRLLRSISIVATVGNAPPVVTIEELMRPEDAERLEDQLP